MQRSYLKITVKLHIFGNFSDYALTKTRGTYAICRHMQYADTIHYIAKNSMMNEYVYFELYYYFSCSQNATNFQILLNLLPDYLRTK